MATILTKKSDTASAVPLAADLTNAAGGAELAVNATDKRLFSKTSGGTVVELGTNPTAMAVVGNTTVGGTLGVTGATTLAGVSATTLSASSTVTLSGGTANGVAYLNGSKVVTSGSALTFDGTLLTVASSTPKIRLSDSGLANDFGIDFYFPSIASSYGQVTLNGSTGGMRFVAGKSGSSGYYQAFELNGSEQMRLTSTGLGIGTSSPASKLHVDNGSGCRLYVGLSNNIYEQAYDHIWQTLSGASTKMTLDSSGNLGLGVTPSAWGSTWKAIQVGMGGSIFARTADQNRIGITANAFFDTAFKYIGTGQATFYDQDDGNHYWYNAPSGTAGNAITFSQAMTLTANGELMVGTTTATGKASIAGAITATASSALVNPSVGVFGLYTGGAIPNTYVQMPSGGSIDFWKADTGVAARIDSSGNLLVGTTSALSGFSGARAAFKAPSTTSSGLVAQSQGAGYEAGAFWNTDTTGNNTFLIFGTEAAYTGRGSITYNRAGGLTTYNTTSDYRAKDILGPVTGSGALIDSVPVYVGKMKGATQERPMFIAHETPEYAHTGEKDAVDEDGNPVYQQMDASALIPVMWAEIQSLRKRLADAGL